MANELADGLHFLDARKLAKEILVAGRLGIETDALLVARDHPTRDHDMLLGPCSCGAWHWLEDYV
ncbi:MAG: hypothetical protein WCV82_03765 [Candidatus Paceibacterota bacterium]